MTATALAKHAASLQEVFERYHVGWETRNPDLIASLHSEDTVFHVHDGSAAVHGREALRKRCVDTFAKFDFSPRWGAGFMAMTIGIRMDDGAALEEPGDAPFTSMVEMPMWCRSMVAGR